jgi:hypothetical protein
MVFLLIFRLFAYILTPKFWLIYWFSAFDLCHKSILSLIYQVLVTAIFLLALTFDSSIVSINVLFTDRSMAQSSEYSHVCAFTLVDFLRSSVIKRSRGSVAMLVKVGCHQAASSFACRLDWHCKYCIHAHKPGRIVKWLDISWTASKNSVVALKRVGMRVGGATSPVFHVESFTTYIAFCLSCSMSLLLFSLDMP